MTPLIWITVIIGTFGIAGCTYLLSICRVPMPVRVIDRRPTQSRTGPPSQRNI